VIQIHSERTVGERTAPAQQLSDSTVRAPAVPRWQQCALPR
jgi:hypothetical protein